MDLLVAGSDWDYNGCEGYVKKIPNFIKADANHLPFRDDIFDIVYSSHLLEHVENDKTVLAEMKRVSRREVRIVVPFALYVLFELFLLTLINRSSERVLYLRKHHKRSYGLNPFHAKHVKLNYIRRFPLPHETETIILKSQHA